MNDQFDKAKEDILRYQELVKGWDDYEGTTPTEGTINSSFLFIDLIRLEDFPAPTAMLTVNGEVDLYWETEGRYLEVEFEGEETFLYSVNSKGAVKKVEGLAVNEPIPSSLREELNLIDKYF